MAFFNILITLFTDVCLDYGLRTMTTNTLWQSDFAHISPSISGPTDIVGAALHHRGHCLFVFHFRYFFGN